MHLNFPCVTRYGPSAPLAAGRQTMGKFNMRPPTAGLANYPTIRLDRLLRVLLWWSSNCFWALSQPR